MAEHKAKSSRNKSASKGHQILIVDSEPCTLASTSLLLKRLDYRILTATTGKEAREAALRTPSCIIITPDLIDIDGMELTRQLRQNANTARTPVVVVRRRDSEELNDQCREHRVEFLSHPLQPEALYAAVQAATEQIPRMCIRLRTVLPVKVHSAQHDTLYGAYTLALSSGGMFLRTMNPVTVKSRITLELNVNGRAIPAETEVLYNCQTGCGESGVGLRFIDIASDDREIIRNYIKSQVMEGFPAEDPVQ